MRRDERPCAVIGPAPPPPACGGGGGNISPRRTYQENMTRIVIQSPTAIKAQQHHHAHQHPHQQQQQLMHQVQQAQVQPQPNSHHQVQPIAVPVPHQYQHRLQQQQQQQQQPLATARYCEGPTLVSTHPTHPAHPTQSTHHQYQHQQQQQQLYDARCAARQLPQPQQQQRYPPPQDYYYHRQYAKAPAAYEYAQPSYDYAAYRRAPVQQYYAPPVDAYAYRYAYAQPEAKYAPPPAAYATPSPYATPSAYSVTPSAYSATPSAYGPVDAAAARMPQYKTTPVAQNAAYPYAPTRANQQYPPPSANQYYANACDFAAKPSPGYHYATTSVQYATRAPYDPAWDSQIQQPKYASPNPLARIPTDFSPDFISAGEVDAAYKRGPPYRLPYEAAPAAYAYANHQLRTAQEIHERPYEAAMYDRSRMTNAMGRSPPKRSPKTKMEEKPAANNLKQFLENWSEEYEDAKAPEGEAPQLYVVNKEVIPEEELFKFRHLPRVDRLPTNIKDATKPAESCQQVVRKATSLSPSMGPSPAKIPRLDGFGNNNNEAIDVEAKITQSVIHKEVKCNFEIKPCSPSNGVKVRPSEVRSPEKRISPKPDSVLVNNFFGNSNADSLPVVQATTTSGLCQSVEVISYSDSMMEYERKINKESRVCGSVFSPAIEDMKYFGKGEISRTSPATQKGLNVSKSAESRPSAAEETFDKNHIPIPFAAINLADEKNINEAFPNLSRSNDDNVGVILNMGNANSIVDENQILPISEYFENDVRSSNSKEFVISQSSNAEKNLYDSASRVSVENHRTTLHHFESNNDCIQKEAVNLSQVLSPYRSCMSNDALPAKYSPKVDAIELFENKEKTASKKECDVPLIERRNSVLVKQQVRENATLATEVKIQSPVRSKVLDDRIVPKNYIKELENLIPPDEREIKRLCNVNPLVEKAISVYKDYQMSSENRVSPSGGKLLSVENIKISEHPPQSTVTESVIQAQENQIPAFEKIMTPESASETCTLANSNKESSVLSPDGVMKSYENHLSSMEDCAITTAEKELIPALPCNEIPILETAVSDTLNCIPPSKTKLATCEELIVSGDKVIASEIAVVECAKNVEFVDSKSGVNDDVSCANGESAHSNGESTHSNICDEETKVAINDDNDPYFNSIDLPLCNADKSKFEKEIVSRKRKSLHSKIFFSKKLNRYEYSIESCDPADALLNNEISKSKMDCDDPLLSCGIRKSQIEDEKINNICISQTAQLSTFENEKENGLFEMNNACDDMQIANESNLIEGDDDVPSANINLHCNTDKLFELDINSPINEDVCLHSEGIAFESNREFAMNSVMDIDEEGVSLKGANNEDSTDDSTSTSSSSDSLEKDEQSSRGLTGAKDLSNTQYRTYMLEDSFEDDGCVKSGSVMLCGEPSSDVFEDESSSEGKLEGKLESGNVDFSGLEIAGCWIDDIACVETVVAEENNNHKVVEMEEMAKEKCVSSPSSSTNDSNEESESEVEENDDVSDKNDKLESSDKVPSDSEDFLSEPYKKMYAELESHFGMSDSKSPTHKTKRKSSRKDGTKKPHRKASTSSSTTHSTPIKTKAAQKYIPPIECHLPLPENILKSLKKPSPSDEAKPNRNRMTLPKKPPKPFFGDVLQTIDETNMTMIKMKLKRKKAIPKMIIKKDDRGAHYASSVAKKDEPPPGRAEWQPQVCLQRSASIEGLIKDRKH